MLLRVLTIFTLTLFFGTTAQTQDQLLLTVTDASEGALEGATITTLPQHQAYFTNALGQAKVPKTDSLLINYLGLESRIISWGNALSQGGRIQLSGAGVALPEIVVGDKSFRRDLSQQQVRIAALDIQRVQANTPAEALSATAGAFVQMSQLGGGSPVLRGFEANRVLLVIDGIRMNNAIYRSGHLQNAITIDENALSSLEVSYGPGALAYGSDAIGGLIHFKTKSPKPHGQDRKTWSGGASFRYGTAAREQSLTTDLVYQSKYWSSYTNFTASRFGDLKAGSRRPEAYPDFGRRPFYAQRVNGEDIIQSNNDPDRQIGSGYDQLDLLQKVSWQAQRKLLLTLNLQYSTSSNVPRYDRLIETRNDQPRFAEWYYGPQERALAALSVDWEVNRPWADKLRFIASYQSIAEDRFDRPFGSPWREESLVQVNLGAITIDAHKRIRTRASIQYGIEVRSEAVEASAARQSLEDDSLIRDVNTRYPSAGSSLDSYSAFLQYQQHSKDSSLLWESGLRWTRRELFAQFGENDPIAWPDTYLDGIDNLNNVFNAATGLRWQTGRWQWRTHLASGFRAPNVDDFAKFRENNGFVQIPNPDLEPERSISADVSVRYRQNRNSHVQLTLYRTWLKNAMVREDFQLPDGANSFISRGDTLFVQAIVNAERAKVWGISASTQQTLAKNWLLQGQLHYTYGRRDFKVNSEETVEVPLDHIPPLYGHLQIDYRESRWEFGLQWQFQARKDLTNYAVSSISKENGNFILDQEGTSDNLDLTPIDSTTGTFAGSYDWSIWNLNAAYRVGQFMRIRLRVENIMDIHYRPFSSGISAPGRNFVLGVYSWF